MGEIFIHTGKIFSTKGIIECDNNRELKRKFDD